MSVQPISGAMPPYSVSVLQIADKTAQDATSTFVPGKVVTYQLSTGTTGSVWLPNSQFSVDAVKAAIAADAQTLYAVSQIKL